MASLHINTPFRLGVAIVGVLVAYYFTPVNFVRTGDLLNLAITGVAIAALIYVVRAQWLHYLDDTIEGGAYGGLALGLIVVVAVFALGYFVLETNSPSQFEGLVTRTDALYFTMTTLTTTGFGDIYASGGFARILVSANMFFNLVFIAAVGVVLRNRLGARLEARESD
ncbi:MAG: ion channel [Ornithinimicrobium sp.]